MLALALACRAASGPAGPPRPDPAPTASREFPAFPSSATPPPFADIAGMLARGFPEPDRPAATRLLLDEILPWDLRDLPSDPDAVPGPRAIARAAYDTLADQLGRIARDRRLLRLATMACSRRGVRLTGRATSLAVARYVSDRGQPRSNLVVGYLGEARGYLAMTQEQLQGEADSVERDLAAFERGARGDKDCHERQRVALIHARHALGCARSGRFDAAMGPLYVFLRHAGERPQHLQPH